MFFRFLGKHRQKHEGENPFWISFSDLMSALMVLFLVVMAVTLVTVMEGAGKAVEAQAQRNEAISRIMKMIADHSAGKGVAVDGTNFRIDLGKEVLFERNSYAISADAAKFLRAYVPVLLKAKETSEGKEWMRRIVVEGFTDEDGAYLYNLTLSLNRSKSVVCSLFSAQSSEKNILTDAQLRQVQALFLVGGYSFNSIRKDKAASRRVEFRIDFWGVDEKKSDTKNDIPMSREFGSC